MKEMYWMEVLSNVGESFIGFMILFSTLLIFFIIALFLVSTEEEKFQTINKKFLKPVLIGFIISLIGVIFIPSEKEMIRIYGIGNTIDYIKSNDKAKKLPDKAVDALSRYLDSIEKEE